MTSFKDSFEARTPEYIAAAWDFADRSDKVDRLWVYVSQDRGALAGEAYYQVGNEYFLPYQLSTVIEGLDTSHDAQSWLFDRINDQTRAMLLELDDVAEMPARMILRFDTAEQSLSAEFLHGELQPGVPDDELRLDARIADEWFERLKATGNDSAEL
ncbi:hypothetical protein [uncultured Tessaracoccus sp.]|uniref:hypothetical protein n=1 Tax=uncultured Tessaracoccus sp. TaxID=905023 RepID=UPI0025E85F2A|nr:hypothetical protein [uncultured Tessaracoccus sp.]